MKMWKIEIKGEGGGYRVYWLFALSSEGAEDTARKLYPISDSDILDVVEHEFFREQLIA